MQIIWMVVASILGVVAVSIGGWQGMVVVIVHSVCSAGLFFVAKRKWKKSENIRIQRFFPPALTVESNDLQTLGSVVSKQWIELQKTQSVLDAIREGVVAFDSAGTLTFSNSSATNIFDWSIHN